MHEPELPDSAVNAIEQRIKRRLRRRMTMVGLTFVLGITVVGGIVSPAYADKHTWGTMTALLLVVWIPYALWYGYRALIERGIRREIERERQLMDAGIKPKRSDRLADQDRAEDEPWIEADPSLAGKPKRRLEN